MGSQSDWATMKHAADMLAALKIPTRKRIVSAHRTPKRLFDFTANARKNGFKVIIAGAGGGAHLPGMMAAMTPLPVLGVPMNTHALEGMDSLLSIMYDAGRDQCRAVGGRRAGAVGPENRQAARRLARAPDQGRGSTSERLTQPIPLRSERNRVDRPIFDLAAHMGIE